MTLLWQLVEPILGPLILALLGGAAWWGNGKLKERKGRKLAEADAREKAARDNAATVERVLNETPSADPVSDIRKRLRDRAGKP
jgi:hypothetical protein